MLRNATPEDAGRIAEIYNHYIENTVITFEDTAVTAAIMADRIAQIQEKGRPFIVYEENGETLGYAYASTWRARPAFNITLETSVYIDVKHLGQGIGSRLYAQLIERTRAIGIHSLIGVIALPNDVSRRLHQKTGFDLIGNFRKTGQKFGRLVDVEFWQLRLQP
ncbi:MAG: GNAT family N-acetyltransferase [Prevotella sp.]|jgi:phosphinothricin acetyltransferase|nr:GNAT family N-acetyltransferase [Prevotella sp.]